MLDSSPRIIAIGGSAGAVDAVKALCGSLSPELAAAVCIVIHIGACGLNVLANIFDNDCPFPVRTAEDGVRLELEIALGRPIGTDDIAQLGEPTTLTCLECGGVLTELRRSSPLRFRCQVGHAFTGEALNEHEETALDEAMRVALRIVEERATLTDKMARQAHRTGMRLSAADLDARAAEARKHALVLREAIRKYG